MTRFPVSLLACAAALVILPARAPAQSVRAEIDTAIAEYLAAHPEQVQVIVKDYLTKNPDVLSEALTNLIKRRMPNGAVAQNGAPAPGPDKTAAIHDNAAAILQSPHRALSRQPCHRRCP